MDWIDGRIQSNLQQHSSGLKHSLLLDAFSSFNTMRFSPNICIYGYMQCCYRKYRKYMMMMMIFTEGSWDMKNLTNMCFCSLLMGTFIEIFIHCNMYRYLSISKVDFWINRKCSIENAFWFYHTHWCLPPFLCKFSQSICKFAFKRDQNNEKITKRSQWMNRLRKGTRHNIIMEKICCV